MRLDGRHRTGTRCRRYEKPARADAHGLKAAVAMTVVRKPARPQWRPAQVSVGYPQCLQWSSHMADADHLEYRWRHSTARARPTAIQSELDSNMSRGTIRLFLLVEGAGFLLPSLVHRGLLVSHYDHAEAAIA